MSLPVPGLAAAAAAAVAGDGPVAVGRHEHHLVVRGAGVERPAVAEHDRLPAAPVIGEDLGAVGGDDRAHAAAPSVAGLAAAWAASTDLQDAASTVATGAPAFFTLLRPIRGGVPFPGDVSRLRGRGVKE